jgi:hypothetical protein
MYIEQLAFAQAPRLSFLHFEVELEQREGVGCQDSSLRSNPWSSDHFASPNKA